MSALNGHSSLDLIAAPLSGDFITDFMAMTEATTSPDLFKKWTAISLVAGALERRVWINTGRGNAYPNLYVLLMASPGVGKFVIEQARELWQEARDIGGLQAFHVAPDNMTKASLLDRLAKAKRTFIPPSGPMETYHSLLIAAEEFSVLFPAYDNEYLGILNSIFNIKGKHEESRRTGQVKELIIERPVLNILAGYQPALMATTFPEEAWSSGLSRRLIMVYSSEPTYRDLFFYSENDTRTLRASLVSRLGTMASLYGLCRWQLSAAEIVRAWDEEGRGRGGLPIPQHSKLVHYLRSRTQLVLKLCIISAISRSGLLVIEDLDSRRAISWLLEVEVLMPDIFREMVGRSDVQVIEEMHLFVQALWAKDSRKPVQGDLIWRFLAQRVPSERVGRVLEVAERANIIARVAGTMDSWVPRPRPEHGME